MSKDKTVNKIPKISFIHTIKVLINMCFKAYPAYFIVLIVFLITMSTLSATSVIVIQHFFNSVEAAIGKNGSQAFSALAIFAVFMIVQECVKRIVWFMSDHAELKAGRVMNYEYHKKASKIKPIAFESADELNTINKALEGAKKAPSITATTLISIVPYYLPFFVIMSVYLFTIQPALILIFALIFIPTLVSLYMDAKINTDLENKVAPERRELDYNMRYITDREFYKETRQWGAFSFFRKILKSTSIAINQKIWKAESKSLTWGFICQQFSGLSYFIIQLLLLSYLIKGDINIGIYAALSVAIDEMFNTVYTLLFHDIKRCAKNMGALRNYVEFLETPEKEYPKCEFDAEQGIMIKNVSFKYPGTENMALKNINLTIKNGETIAIVGENGAGKSTLFKLIIGLFEPTSGQVNIGGCDTKIMSSEQIYIHISSVFQNYQRYKMTFRENVSISNVQDVDDDKIKKVNSQVNIFDEQEIDDIMDTMLSREFDGIDLSGGKWQRTAIARGLYRTHDFIMLDEPTAAIDPIEETYIYKSFAELTKDKTSVLITHRLGAAKIASRIILVGDGEIKEEGTHEDLINKGGLYAEMYQSQSGWYQ